MTDIVLTFPDFPDGTTANGGAVITNFEDVLDVANGTLDDTNIADDGITASAKLKDGTVTLEKMAPQAVDANVILWPQASNGVRAWRTNGYAGANGNRLIRFEKSVTLASADTSEHSIAIDWSASDSPDGAITFGTATPTITGLTFLDDTSKISGAANAALKYLVVSARSATGCTILYRFSSTATAGNVTIMGMASGAA